MLYRAGAVNKLVKEMEKYKIDICALQENNLFIGFRASVTQYGERKCEVKCIN
jgi:hypothetical protein